MNKRARTILFIINSVPPFSKCLLLFQCLLVSVPGGFRGEITTLEPGVAIDDPALLKL